MLWEELSLEERTQFITEYNPKCGIQYFFHTQDVDFEPCCQAHDYAYQYKSTGNSKYGRLIADLLFLQCMLRTILNKDKPYYSSKFLMYRAVAYFTLVRLFGWYFWNKKR